MDFIRSLCTSIARWRRRRRVKTPTVLQIETAECGAAALGIILGYYGRIVPLAELRRVCGVSRDGSKASHLLQAARQYGLSAQGFSVKLEAVKNLPGPYIVFWEFNHFLVVEGFRGGRVYLNDPQSGPRTMAIEDFANAFTGIVLAMSPGPGFTPGGLKPSTIQALRARLQGVGRVLVYCFGAGFLLVLPGVVVPIISQVYIDRLLIAGRHDWLRPLLVGMLMTAIFRALVQHLQLRALLRLKIRLSTVMSSHFLWHMLHLPIHFYAQRYGGEIAQRLVLNDKVADVLSGRLATTVVDACMMSLYSAIMLQYDLTLTMIGLGCAALNLLALQWIARRRVDANMRLLQETGKVNGVAFAGLQQIETLKAAGLESDFFARWSGAYAKSVNAQQALDVTNQTLSHLPTLLTALASMFVLVMGGHRVMEGHLSIGMLIALQSLMQSFLAPATRLINFGQTLQELQGDLHRLDDVLRNPVIAEPIPESHLPITPATFRLQGYVEVRNVTFRQSPVTPPILDHVSLSLTPGKRVAIVGASGSGKSTLAKLVCGLYDPTAGEILFDDVPRSQIPRAILTHSIAMVDQDLAFFTGTLRDNLTLWDATVPDRELVRACKDAAVHDVIVALPGGYASPLMEGAANLSGGERQRLELARALVNNPAILVLDEATSALDAEVEQRIVENLRRRGCTCLIVAHRLSTIRYCDEIIVLDSGQVMQRGTHDDLIGQDGLYRHLLDCEANSRQSLQVSWRQTA